MSGENADPELHRWCQSFRESTEVPMALQRDVKRQARGRAAAAVLMAVVIAGESTIGGVLLATDSSAHARWMAAFLIGFSVVMGAIFVRSQRGLWRTSTLSPEALLDVMERRVAAGQRLARMSPFTSLICCAAVIALVLSADAPAETKIGGTVFGLAVLAFTFVMRRFGLRKLEARRLLLARWRSERSAG